MSVYLSFAEAVRLGVIEPKKRSKKKHLNIENAIDKIPGKKNTRMRSSLHQAHGDNQPVASAKEATIILPGRPATKKNSMILNSEQLVPLPSRAFQRYEKQCLKALLVYRKICFTGNVHLCIHYWLPDRRWWPDLAGLIEATQDILEKAGIIENDRYVVSLDGTRIMGLDKGNPRAEILIAALGDGDNLIEI